jgi:hypothetical protein
MKLDVKSIIIIGLVIFAGFQFYKQNITQQQLEEATTAARTELIAKDSLQKINEGLYTKLAADTLTIAELRRLNDSLGLALGKKPTVIIQTEFLPAPQTGDADVAIGALGEIKISDRYPKSEETPFVKYEALVSLEDTTAVGTFTFNPISINLGIEETEEGLFRVNTKVPDWLQVNSIDVQSLPMTLPKQDKFGVLLGGGYGRDFQDDSQFLYLSGGLRYKKIYLEINGGTNETLSTGLKLEF